MQYLKIEIPKDKDLSRFPTGYNNIENFINDHVYITEKDTDKEFLCLEILDGISYDKILGNLDRITLLTKEEMIGLCEPYEQKREIITDEVKVRRLAIKVQMQRKLTEEEEKALDPDDDSVLGFGMSKRFVDRISESK